MLLTAALACLSFAAPITPGPLSGSQDPAESKPSGQGVVRSDLDRVLANMLEALGGGERIERFSTASFRITTTVDVIENEGEEPVQKELPPVSFELRYGRGAVIQRIEETFDESQLVKIVSQEGARVWVDGKRRALPELELVAVEQAASTTLFLDQIYGLMTGVLEGRFDGVRNRDGVDYDVISATFHPSRGINAPLRVYVDRESHVVARIDVFDAETRRRTRTIRFADYEMVDGLAFPKRLEFMGRDKTVMSSWRIDEVQIDPEIEGARFEGP